MSHSTLFKDKIMQTFLNFLMERAVPATDSGDHWHGSPHDFAEFSRKNTAHTGEGGAAYGSGIYITNTKEVGQHYRDFNKGSKTRRLYKVHLSINPDRMMHWHKKVSEQPSHVQKTLKKIAPDYDWSKNPDPPAKHIFHHIRSAVMQGGASRVESSEIASNTLHRSGIHGIEYQGDIEGKAKSPPTNRVIFDPKKIKVVAKYDENDKEVK
jgi:hypothetical protein